MNSIEQLNAISQQQRQSILKMCLAANTGHVTSSLSCVEILVSLYYTGILRFDVKQPNWQGRDRFILSKAQASPLLYSILGDLGFFDKKKLMDFAQADGIFGVHLQHDVPGVETTAGALGHGLGLAAGIALAARMNRELHLTYVLMGDGELYEGSIWESMKFAAHQQLNNLIGIIDRNYLCTTDFTENLVALEPLDKKIESFGWDVHKVDGHCISSMMSIFEKLKNRPSRKPQMIIAETVKGKGIPSMCYDPLFHGIAPQGDIIEAAKKELKLK